MVVPSYEGVWSSRHGGAKDLLPKVHGRAVQGEKNVAKSKN